MFVCHIMLYDLYPFIAFPNYLIYYFCQCSNSYDNINLVALCRFLLRLEAAGAGLKHIRQYKGHWKFGDLF